MTLVAAWRALALARIGIGKVETRTELGTLIFGR